ncbi:MAG: site-specific DNA-methyltransferase [Thermodesulfobacteriota bacterium]|nr:site-specific DNA-methyltransferase [Thermodesulfobacteriota bacterium]
MNFKDMTDKVICGDCLEVMKDIPSKSIDLTVTSPPYDNLRDYKGYNFDFEGLANELFRTTKDRGVVVWVVGDATINGSETGTSFRQALFFKEIGFNLHDTMIYACNKPPLTHKRYEQSFEYMFVFIKGNIKTFNPILKKNEYVGQNSIRNGNWASGKDNSAMRQREEKKNVKEYGIINNIWYYETGGNKTTKDKIAFEHPAIFPEKLVEDHIKSWSNEGDIVLDPFLGSGTTAKVAKKLKRKYIGIDISEEYCKLARLRVGGQKKVGFEKCKKLEAFE